MDDEPGRIEPVTEEARIQTFLIADVRGYTLFTQQRGDEAAAKLAAKFARIARETVQQRGGSVIELRGDEALAVFSSARQAVAAAVDLQERQRALEPAGPIPKISDLSFEPHEAPKAPHGAPPRSPGAYPRLRAGP